MRRLALLIVGVMSLGATAQALSVRDLNSGVTAQDMVNTLLGGGVTVSNIKYTGAPNASGLFCSGISSIGFDTGILLTSGDAANVIGPNNSPAASKDNQLGGDPDLTALISVGVTNQTFDAAVLEFDFVPESNTVQFSYVFGSEEYNEFVNSSFNDVFAFFVNGVNFALIPGTTTPVSINNVNNGFSPGTSTGPCMNCAFYIDNTGATLDTQLDGLTVVLTFTAPVQANQVNHMKIAIADGGDHALDSAVLLKAGSLRSGTVASFTTRTSRFWFTHSDGPDPTCATLSNAMVKIINLNCGTVPLGFVDLPVGFRNNDNVKDAADAVIEGLGLYWKNVKLTGEVGGTQGQKSKASALCTRRKELAAELIAAMANVNYLDTDPSKMTYINAGTNTTFPSDLISQARGAAAGDDPSAIVSMTALLRAFNSSGLTNDFPTGIVECSAQKNKDLKKLARDPTTQLTCPGVNTTCDTAETVVFPNSGNPFASAVFKRSVDLSKYVDSVQGPSCGVGGRDATWQVKPTVGTNGRHFIVNTAGSNFDTMISVWTGTCSNLVQVTGGCTNGVIGVGGESLPFTTDGTNTYRIVVEGPTGNYGKLKVKITSQ